MGGGTFFKVGRHKCTSKSYKKYLRFELTTVASKVLKYDVITYTQYEGPKSKLHYFRQNYTPLRKRIGEPPEIQIGCYTGDPGQ